MKECKHRWEESNFGIKYRTPDHIMYECQRCNKLISTIKSMEDLPQKIPRNQKNNSELNYPH